MKKIILLRHAKAERPPDVDDFDRPLAEKGEKDSKTMGKFLRKAKIIPNIIISSPALRAMHTAELVADKLKIKNIKIMTDKTLYTIDNYNLLEYIKNLDNSFEIVLLCGHNPAFEGCAAKILHAANFAMPTASLVSFSAEDVSWKEFTDAAAMEFFITPALAKKFI